jgi:site-specific DNA-methyltransferase (adenine-specific)
MTTGNESRRTVGHARLYRMRAQEALAALPAGSISIVITDPPYTTVDRHSQSGHLRRWFTGSMPWPEIGKVLALARGKLRPDGVAFVMTNSDGLPEALAAMTQAGFTRVRPITWDKRTPGLGGGLRHRTEHVLVAYLPGSRTLAASDLVAVPAVGPGTTGRYPTEKPEGLGRKLAAIATVGPADVALDPFCGSGALLVGAKERGATVIGCDIASVALRRAAAKLGLRQSAITMPTVTSATPKRPSRTPTRRTPRGPRRATTRHGQPGPAPR